MEELAKSVLYNRKIISISVIFGKTEHVVKLIEWKNLSTSVKNLSGSTSVGENKTSKCLHQGRTIDHCLSISEANNSERPRS